MSLERSGLADWLQANRITTIRVEGTNLDGSLLGKFVSPAKFLASVDVGVTVTDLVFGADLKNVPYMGFAWPQWRGNLLDVYLKPDLGTLVVWRPGMASVIADFCLADGTPLSLCPRSLLKRHVGQLAEAGYSALTAIEIEASVFEESIHEARDKGFQGLRPLGGGAGACYHLAKSSDWYEYMSAVTARLDEVGLAWEAWNDEAAAGQIELNLPPADPVAVADAWTRARQIMREVAFDQGRSVTFMAKWCDEYGQASHLNISLGREGVNAFYAEDGPSEAMSAFIGGVMATLAGVTSFAMPWITSYRRLVEMQGPPTTLTWGVGNKSAAIRAIVGHPKASRLECRVPGSDSNVYVVLGVTLAAGGYGLAHALPAPPETAALAWGATDRTAKIPDSITRAADALSADPILREVLGEEFVDYWVGTRRWEWWAFHTTGGDPDGPLCPWESTRYFELV